MHDSHRVFTVFIFYYYFISIISPRRWFFLCRSCTSFPLDWLQFVFYHTHTSHQTISIISFAFVRTAGYLQRLHCRRFTNIVAHYNCSTVDFSFRDFSNGKFASDVSIAFAYVVITTFRFYLAVWYRCCRYRINCYHSRSLLGGVFFLKFNQLFFIRIFLVICPSRVLYCTSPSMPT